MEIRCPQCDGQIEVGTEHIVTKCPYCRTRLFYEKEKLLTRESIKPTHDSGVAVNLLRSIAGKELDVRMKYYPFYRIRAEGKTDFLPAKKIDAIGIKNYEPQGDREPLDFDVPEPDFSIDAALERMDVSEGDSIGLVYVPFFVARDKEKKYYVDAARGEVFSSEIVEYKITEKNFHPHAVLAAVLAVLSAVLIPGTIFSIITVLIISGGFWYFEREVRGG